MRSATLLVSITAALMLACGGSSKRGPADAQSDSTGMVLTSGSFAAGESIPAVFHATGPY